MTDSMSTFSPNKDRSSLRTILESLILAGIVGLVGMVLQQGKDSAKADADRSQQIAVLQTQIAALQTTLAGLPDLTTRLARAEMSILELQHRQNQADQMREQQNIKGWAR